MDTIRFNSDTLSTPSKSLSRLNDAILLNKKCFYEILDSKGKIIKSGDSKRFDLKGLSLLDMYFIRISKKSNQVFVIKILE